MSLYIFLFCFQTDLEANAGVPCISSRFYVEIDFARNHCLRGTGTHKPVPYQYTLQSNNQLTPRACKLSVVLSNADVLKREYERVNLKYELPILAPVPVIDPATGLQRIDPATQQPVFKIPTVTYANHGRYCTRQEHSRSGLEASGRPLRSSS